MRPAVVSEQGLHSHRTWRLVAADIRGDLIGSLRNLVDDHFLLLSLHEALIFRRLKDSIAFILLTVDTHISVTLMPSIIRLRRVDMSHVRPLTLLLGL